MLFLPKIAKQNAVLNEHEIIETLHQGLDGQFARQKVLVLIPDHTRSLPLPYLFQALVEILHDTRQLDFMVALGTHPSLLEDSLNKLVGISSDERSTIFKHIGLLNHDWDNPLALITLGVLEQDEIWEIAGERWHSSLPDQISRNLWASRMASSYCPR